MSHTLGTRFHPGMLAEEVLFLRRRQRGVAVGRTDQAELVSVKNLPLGTPRQAKLTLYNNDAEPRRYRLTSKTFPTSAGQVPPISLSQGYEWIPEPSWVSPARGPVTVGSQERAAVRLRITIPKEPGHRGRNWESILFIESDDGRTRFLRVRIQTER